MPQRHCRVLVVEDECVTALALEQVLGALGYEPIGPVGSVGEALKLVETARTEMAIVDLNLHGELSLPVIRVLRERDVPVVLATASSHSAVPEEFRSLPRLEKPFSARDVRAALDALADAVSKH